MTKITPNSLPSLTICSRLPFVAHSMTFGTRSKSVVAKLHFTSRLCWSNLTCCQVPLGTVTPPCTSHSPPPASLPCMAQSFGYCSLGSHDPRALLFSFSLAVPATLSSDARSVLLPCSARALPEASALSLLSTRKPFFSAIFRSRHVLIFFLLFLFF